MTPYYYGVVDTPEDVLPMTLLGAIYLEKSRRILVGADRLVLDAAAPTNTFNATHTDKWMQVPGEKGGSSGIPVGGQALRTPRNRCGDKGFGLRPETPKVRHFRRA